MASKIQRTSLPTVTRTTPFQDLPEWLSPIEVQRFLGVSRCVAYRLVNRLPRRRFGRHLRVSKHNFKPLKGAK